MYYTYIIKSLKTGKYYIGSTSDITKRLYYHNHNSNKSTSNKGPWQLVYAESFELKAQASAKEKLIKSYKGGNSFKRLVLSAPR